ncbi:UNVERIFIED_CONTAM: hypothetical protein Sradi_4268000 [Sesamum radiatum]|uniref:Translocon-associated protein subunit beta n=1 Tax=Sesamum radiatum TaxID=300843 RepID=A0AAW2P840_SESRA
MAISNFAPAISILAALFFAASTIASSDAPFIVAHKKASLTRLKSGSERVSVSIDIYNQGYATAYDVTLNDDSWSQDVFDIVSGNTSVSWERLDARHTQLQSSLLMLLADRPPEKKFDWRLLAKYGSLVSVISIVVLFVYLVSTPSKSSASKASKKKR